MILDIDTTSVPVSYANMSKSIKSAVEEKKW